MSPAELIYLPYRQARPQVRDGDLLLFRRRGLISIAGRGDHSHAAKAAWWSGDLSDWRPSAWNQAPPRATALEPVDDGLVSADEAALFLEGFNRSMLGECDRPIWAVAVPITVRYEGDAEVGESVQGTTFAIADADELAPDAAEAGESPQRKHGHFHGLGQSPQRSR